MRRLIIWEKKDGVIYHRLINGSYYEQDYKIGSINSYGHKVIHIVDDFDFYKKKVPFKTRVIDKSINFLSKYR